MIGNAVRVMEIATSEREEREPGAPKNEAAAELGQRSNVVKINDKDNDHGPVSPKSHETREKSRDPKNKDGIDLEAARRPADGIITTITMSFRA